MSLLNYVDTREAAMSALKDLTNVKRECDRLPCEIVFTADEIRKLKYSIQQRPSNRKAAKLEALKVRRSALMERLADLEEYLPFFAACWDHLEQWERDSLYCRFISCSLGIKAFGSQYHICRSDAYRKSDAALKRLSKLLYW